MNDNQALRLFKQIEERVAGKTGDAFFSEVTAALMTALHAHAAFAGQLDADHNVSMLSYRVGAVVQPNATYKLEGTPCDFVYRGEITAHGRNLCEAFPFDRAWFESMDVKSYLGVPLQHETGEVFGHLAVMDSQERDWLDADIDVMRLVALRGAAELERYRYERQLEATNGELQREIERRQEVENALIAARRAAEVANNAKSAFISNMSHELRTPLNGILGYTQLLAKDPSVLTDAQREGLEIIERSGEHLLTLINDLLDLSKIEAGKVELQLDALDLAAATHDVAHLIEIRTRNARQHFNHKRATDLPVVLGDGRALRQVLLNLLGNAVKFTPPGGIVTLHERVSRYGDNRCAIEFVIEDTGKGIAQSELTSIFEPFHRLVDATEAIEGTGLGLTITQRLVEAMNGQIDVTSEVGKGSRFIVTLDFEISKIVATRREKKRLIQGYAGPRRTVLIADDDAVSRGLVRQLLEEVEFKVIACGDAETALDRFKQGDIDLVISDLVMPRMSGIEFIRAIRASTNYKATPIIIQSASAGSMSQHELAEISFATFLPKPLDLDTLLEEIGRLLQLMWREGHASQAVKDSISAVDLGAVDPILLQRLRGFAQRGDVMAISQCANLELTADAAHRTLADALRNLAATYDMQGIRKLLSAA